MGEQAFLDREFPMTSANFAYIKKRVYGLTGINLSDHKRSMVYGRLARRLRALGMRNFDEYCRILEDDNSKELHDFVNAITTNLTAFFRENHHFEYLKSTLLPELMQRNIRTKKIRVWSAGCSTGEEPHSIAMVLKSFASLSNWDIKVLATDLDSNVVAHGRAGVYAAERVETVPEQYGKYVKKNKHDHSYCVDDEVRQLITFNQLNLLNEWPMKGKFDIIFCRNVVIYFDMETQKKLFDRYAEILTPNGHIFIGHSENLNKVCNRFNTLGRTIYQRTK